VSFARLNRRAPHADRRPPRRSAALIASGVLVASGVLAVGASCRRAPSNASRENAYRASNLGVALLEQFNYAAAVAQFREALRIEPTLPLARLNLAIALYYLPDHDAALKEAIEAARLSPDAPQAPYLLGLIARDDHRDADALAFFERVRAIDPEDVGSAVNIAQIDLQDRNYDQAIAVLRPSVASEPFNVTATYTLGLALTRANQREAGQRLLEQSQALRATGYGTTFGNGYLEQGRYAEAVASTGAEAGLVDPATPAVTFTPDAILAPAGETLPSPFGRRFTRADLSGEGARRLALSLGGGVTLADIDGDGDLDLCAVIDGRVRLFRNDRGRFTDVTAASGLSEANAAGVALGCIAGDFDNDGHVDLFVMRYGRSSLHHNDGAGTFVDVTGAAGIPATPWLPGAAAFVDLDHDGDLDLVIAGLADLAGSRAGAAGSGLRFPQDFAPAPIQVLRNDGNGRFTDITRAARLQATGHAIAIVPTDFDNHRDVDLLIAYRDRPPVLYKNLRDGTFRDVAADVGLAGVWRDGDEITSVAAGDVNKDDFPDFFFGRARSPAALALSTGWARFVVTAVPTAQAPIAAELVDYDGDGLLDVLTWAADGPHVLRNVGTGWADTTSAATGGGRTPPIASARALAIGDVDGDGAQDAVVLGSPGALSVWRNGGSAQRHTVAIRLRARVSNRSAAGAKVQLRAGSLSQRIEASLATPAAAPADVVFGLGSRRAADVVRVLWPSGVLQAEAAASPLPRTIVVQELDRKPSSCPFLYAWNGDRFEFVTDFMGAGEMGYWEGPGRRNTPDPVEFVRIREDQLRPRHGQYDLRVTNELEETLYLDQLQLVAIDHPADIDVYPNAGMTDPPKPFRLHAVRDASVPRVRDDHGHDVTERIARVDRQYPDDFTLNAIRGYAERHSLTVDIDRQRAAPALVLTGWTDYAFSSDNVAAHQAGWSLTPPSLQVRDRQGRWRTAIADIGIPVGRPQTLVIDLAPVIRPGEHELRIATDMRIYWDQILVASEVDRPPLVTHAIDPAVAVLRERGFSVEARPDGRDPVLYDYDRVTADSPWKVMTGRFTRTGDVRALLARSDDLYVISKPGDEIAVTFPAPPVRAGWRRTFLLKGDGFSKEMDINSASPDRVGPLPFHRMTGYPYSSAERYPSTPEHERYRAEYNTRVVGRN
jgi:cytochrome c-type biogenesis protein CcmH/NrfG